MIICHCEAVNDRRIADEIEAGARDVEAITARCGAGGCCGGCVPTIELLLARHALAEQPAA